ncbi:T9SS type A sorting domain-containing protein [bacterium]|nr:T9SS type A sorting domain-containing protein [bacterium]
MKKILLILSFLFTLGLNSEAQITGGDITITAQDSFTYQVDLVVYRACRSDSIPVPNMLFVKEEGSNDSAHIPLSRKSIEDISQICTSAATGCDPANSPFTGSGMEKHIYTGIIDLNDTSYDHLLNSCVLRFFVHIDERHLEINTGPGGTNYYNFSLFNRCRAPLNNSPKSLIQHRYINACNQPVYRSLGIADTSDRDSLSFSIGDVFTSENTSASFNSGYTYFIPFQVYYGTYTYPFSNPLASPPIGIYLNGETGELVYTPTRCDEVAVIDIVVDEWRDDSIISTTRFERVFTNDTLYNYTPYFEDAITLTYDACVGTELCFDIEIFDPIYVPPPSAPPATSDTGTLSWNHEIEGAEFSVRYEDGIAIGRFCWTPDSADMTGKPHFFTVEATDNYCPRTYSSSTVYSILVREPLNKTVEVDSLGCGLFALESVWDSISGLNAGHSWTLLDSQMNPLPNAELSRFSVSDSNISTSSIDTLKVRKGGTYYIKHELVNFPFFCNNTSYTKINVPNQFTVDLSFRDTTLCYNSSALLVGSTNNAQGSVSYQWYRGDTSYLQDTFAFLPIDAQTQGMDSTYTLYATDQAGCVDFLDTRVQSYDSIVVYFQDSLDVCNDSIQVTITESSNNVQWNNSKTGSTIWIAQSGVYTATITDANQCKRSTSFRADIRPLPIIPLKDTTLCNGDSLDAGPFESFEWSTGATTRYYEPFAQGQYRVDVVDVFGCENSKVFNLWLKIKPAVVILGLDICQDQGIIDLDSQVVLQPTNPLRGDQLWTCLKCNGSDFSKMIEDYSTNSDPDYFLNVQDSVYSVVNNKTDSLYIRYTFTDTNGCAVSKDALFRVHKKPDAPVIYKDNSTGTMRSNDTVFWFRNDSALNRYSDYVNANVFGVYKAYKLDRFNCRSEFSNELERTIGVETIESLGIRYYPNPSSGQVFVEDPGNRIVELHLFDAQGKELLMEYERNGKQFIVNYDAPAQIVWLRVSTENGMYYLKLLNLP